MAQSGQQSAILPFLTEHTHLSELAFPESPPGGSGLSSELPSGQGGPTPAARAAPPQPPSTSLP